MYQSANPPTRATPQTGGRRRRVEAIMGYDGPERDAPPPPRPTLTAITPAVMLGWLGRFWYVVVVVAILGALGGLAAGTLIKPRFTSYSDILLDPSNLQVVADDLYVRNIQGEAQLLDVESKMRILTSTNVLGSVVRTLNLENDPDLTDPEFPILVDLFPSDGPTEDSFTAAVRALSDRVRVRREERSYVVTASVWARTPEKSAELTDAVVAAFLAELARAEADGATTASTALTDRLDQLRDDAAAAEEAVAEYRRANGLQIGTGQQQLSTQSAVQLNGQIATAREALIAAQARYDNLTEASGDGRTNAAAQQSELLGDLRTQYATAQQSADSLAISLGPRHPTLVAAQSQVVSLQGEIDREVGRVTQTARTDLERAQAVLDQLTQAASQQMGAVFTDDDAQVELRQLERTSASNVAIYEAYLTRAQEVTQRSQLNTTNVRVISGAVPPISRNFPPRTVLMIAGGLFAGIVAGLCLAALAGFAGMAMSRRKQA